MNLTNQLHPSDIFKYVNVRKAKSVNIEGGIDNLGFTPYSGVPTSLYTPIPSGSNYLYADLSSLQSQPFETVDILSKVQNFNSNGNYLSNETMVLDAFPELVKMMKYLDSFGDAVNPSRLLQKTDEWFNGSVQNFVSSNNFNLYCIHLWDNLLSDILEPGKELKITLLCKLLGVTNILRTYIKYPERKFTSKVIMELYHAQPLIPKWLLKNMILDLTKADADVNSQTTNAQANNIRERLTTKYVLNEKAIAALNGLLESNRNTNKAINEQIQSEIAPILSDSNLTEEQKYSQIKVIYDANPVTPFYQLTQENIDSLDEQIRNHIESYTRLSQGVDINEIINQAIDFSQSYTSQLGLSLLSTSGYLADSVIQIENSDCLGYDDKPCSSYKDGETKAFNSRGSFVSAVVFGDLLLTKQQLLKYDLGEVAHIETILKGQSKERIHRRLDREETTTSYEKESENELERDTQSTERFSMEKEASNVLNTDFHIEAGINVSATYGPVSASAYVNGGYSSSSQTANSNASSFSKDVMNRTLQRVKDKVRESKSVHILKEIEETNHHVLANATDAHINGVYRWVDKFYMNSIVNYGKRMMLEFNIAEPANFYIFRSFQQSKADAKIKPIHPSKALENYTNPTSGLSNHRVLTRSNYTYWTSLYNVTNIESCPSEFMTYSDAVYSSTAESRVFTKTFNIIDERYNFFEIINRGHQLGDAAGNHYFVGSIVFGHLIFDVDSGTGVNFTKQIAVALLAVNGGWVLNLIFHCKLSAEAFEKWQISTYAAIMESYERQLSEYNEWLNNQKAEMRISGNNPSINRSIEKTELKKRCIEMYTGQRFESNDAAVDGIFNLSGYPEVLFNESIREGNIAKFLEHAFEWNNMTYVFYDYFYARKKKWLRLNTLTDTSDPLFEKFLRSGMARVNVPVRPGFERMVLMFHALSNWISSYGCSWDFNPEVLGMFSLDNEFLPGIEDDTYISIAQELQEAADLNDYGTIVKDPTTGEVTYTNIIDAYIQKVPTNLVYLANIDSAGNPIPAGELPDNTGDSNIQDVMSLFDLD